MESENTPLEHQPLEHQNVPSAHQGLHSFLYSSDDEHSTDSSFETNFDGTNLFKVSEWLKQTEVKIAGVYAVVDSDRRYQYIGYSRDVLRSLKGHIAQNGSQACTFLRVKSFKFPKRQAMEALRDEWIAELDYIPLGNTDRQETWARTIGEAAKATMTVQEQNAYEEKKLKLRKAMADATLIDELAAKDTPGEAETQRRQKLEAAVKNDDWSSIIES
ncbi:GIY-YIG nuclease family protein [Pleurocapsales cyanobacterium LEGE 10410]|nr:GIY-YIG nuclease family protein [Pleurocapsales cyanobacterium LEGE 10410]